MYVDALGSALGGSVVDAVPSSLVEGSVEEDGASLLTEANSKFGKPGGRVRGAYGGYSSSSINGS